MKLNNTSFHHILPCSRTDKDAPWYDKSLLKVKQGQTLYVLNSVTAGSLCQKAINDKWSQQKLREELIKDIAAHLVKGRAKSVYRSRENDRKKNYTWKDLCYFSSMVPTVEFFSDGSEYEHVVYSNHAGLSIVSSNWLNEKHTQHLMTTSKRRMLNLIKQLAENPYGYARSSTKHLESVKDFWSDTLRDDFDDSCYDPDYDYPETNREI